jgi:hypothetical protein
MQPSKREATLFGGSTNSLFRTAKVIYSALPTLSLVILCIPLLFLCITFNQSSSREIETGDIESGSLCLLGPARQIRKQWFPGKETSAIVFRRRVPSKLDPS